MWRDLEVERRDPVVRKCDESRVRRWRRALVLVVVLLGSIVDLRVERTGKNVWSRLIRSFAWAEAKRALCVISLRLWIIQVHIFGVDSLRCVSTESQKRERSCGRTAFFSKYKHRSSRCAWSCLACCLVAASMPCRQPLRISHILKEELAKRRRSITIQFLEASTRLNRLACRY